MMRWFIPLLITLPLFGSETTRALTDGSGRGVEGYIHRSPTPATVRIVIPVRSPAKPSDQPADDKTVDWSEAGTGWLVEVHPGVPIVDARELLPISIHEYRLKEKT